MNFLLFGLIIFILGILGVVFAFAFPSIMRGDHLPYYSPNMLLIFAVIMLIGGSLFLIGFSTEHDYQRRLVTIAVARTPHLLFHLFFTALFIIDLVFLIVFLLFPETFASGVKEHFRDIQVLCCIGTAGILGGFIRQLQTNLRPSELSISDTDNTPSTFSPSIASPYVRFWSTLFSIFRALFTALVLFLLLRAGILKTVEVDTFNVYGVTGVAAVSGYFADSIIRRFSTVYEQLFDPSSRQAATGGEQH